LTTQLKTERALVSSDNINPSTPANHRIDDSAAVVMLSGSKFLFACSAIALVLLILAGRRLCPTVYSPPKSSRQFWVCFYLARLAFKSIKTP
jgi:hypothetical protein